MKVAIAKSLKSLQRCASFLSFELPEENVERYRERKPSFGFNGLGEVVFYRTYSRLKEDGSNETFADVLKRVVEGTYSIQKDWCISNELDWDEEKALEDALLMFDKMFLPSGRGMFAMGTKVVQKNGAQPLNSCAFVSTENLVSHPSKPFEFLMDSSMLGVGVGFDTKGADTVKIVGPNYNEPIQTYVIPDSRGGWVKSTTALLDSYFHGTAAIQYDYSKIRKAGDQLRTFGGTAAGPFPLMHLHNSLRMMLDRLLNQRLSCRNIVDIMNIIGKCVISGNIRRTAEIAFGEAFDTEFYDLKNYELHPERAEFGWTSNNSVFAEIGMDYQDICERIFNNGEPGLAWLENMRAYGRMRENEKDYKDKNVKGANPCMEQSLETFELCNLVETFPFHHNDLEEYLETLEVAYTYAKTVTLLETQWEESNEIMARNRRIGCSMSGIAQFLSQNSLSTLKLWCEKGYDRIKTFDKKISKSFGVNESVKITSIKPSGTISLVAGATPGIHYPESEYYIRRLRISKTSRIIPHLYESGFRVDEDVMNNSAWVVEFPIKVGGGGNSEIRSCDDVSLWEKLNLAAFLQEHWADNQISCTVTFNPNMTQIEDLENALEYYQYKMKGVSFLPVVPDSQPFPQMPYEKITEEEYLRLVEEIKPLDLNGKLSNEEAEGEKFCSNDTCTL